METAFPSNGSFPSLDSIQLTSIAGIIVATTAIVAVLTRVLGNKPLFSKLPAFLYVTAISLLLTFLANRVLKTLPGTIGVLLWDAAKAALASSGFYTWVTGRAGAIETTSAATPSTAPSGTRTGAGVIMLLVLLPMLGGLSGCVTRPELITLREGMDRATTTIRKQHMEWALKLSQGKQSELPTLSPADYRAVLIAHQEYQNLVNSSRTQDGATTQP